MQIPDEGTAARHCVRVVEDRTSARGGLGRARVSMVDVLLRTRVCVCVCSLQRLYIEPFCTLDSMTFRPPSLRKEQL